MKQLYYNLLLKHKTRYRIKVYSYSFMSSHPHLTVACESKELLSAFFRIVNSSFAKTYNKLHNRRGQVIMDRFKSPQIKTDEDHVRVVIYGDFNQVRAGMIKHPKDWKWSSFRHYAYGKEDPLIDDAPFYVQLGKSHIERQRRYNELVNNILWKECIQKQNYSAVYFIGNPLWVQQKMSELRDHVRHLRNQGKESLAQSPPG